MGNVSENGAFIIAIEPLMQHELTTGEDGHSLISGLSFACGGAQLGIWMDDWAFLAPGPGLNRPSDVPSALGKLTTPIRHRPGVAMKQFRQLTS